MSFTPGPWAPGHLADDEFPCDCTYIWGEEGLTLGEVFDADHEEYPSLYPVHEEAQANLRLIVSAPAMYKLLKEVDTRYRPLEGWSWPELDKVLAYIEGSEST